MGPVLPLLLYSWSPWAQTTPYCLACQTPRSPHRKGRDTFISVLPTPHPSPFLLPTTPGFLSLLIPWSIWSGSVTGCVTDMVWTQELAQGRARDLCWASQSEP